MGLKLQLSLDSGGGVGPVPRDHLEAGQTQYVLKFSITEIYPCFVSKAFSEFSFGRVQ